MSKTRTFKTLAASEAATGATTTLVRAEAQQRDHDPSDLHPQLRNQLRELQLRTGSATPDVAMLLRLIDTHYHTIDAERRGIVESMRLMADEARALALEARAQSSEHLQVILDHIKDVVLSLDDDGIVRTFNPTGERVFGYAEAEVVGRRIDVLIPTLAVNGETIPQALQRLAEALGDTALDLAASELWAQRKDGESFPAEIAVSKAPTSRSEMFVLLDVDTGRFMDANVNAEKLFGLERSRLLEVGPVDLSPAQQPDGEPSAQRASNHVQRALEGEPQVFEWMHLDAAGREIMCEVRLVNLPSGGRRLVRGSLADISGRKRAERMAAAEREVFEQISGNVPLSQVLAGITRLVESGSAGTVCTVSVLAEGGQAFTTLVAPQLQESARVALQSTPVDIRHGSSAASVYLGRQVLVADITKDPYWSEQRDVALAAGLQACWATPIKAPGGDVLGALGVYRGEPGLPTAADSQIMARAAQLAGIAIGRRLGEAALRGSEAKFRGLFESIAEGVYQSSRSGRLLSVNPAFVSILGYGSAEEMYSLPGATV